MGKSRAAAFALGIQDIDEGVHLNAFSEAHEDSDAVENSLSASNSLSSTPCTSCIIF